MGFAIPRNPFPESVYIAVANANGGVAIKNPSKWTALRKFGRNPSVGTTLESVWPQGGRWAPPASGAQTITFASDATEDDGSGTPLTGARTIVVYGLDASGDLLQETVTLNGTTSVATSNSFLRVNRAVVATAGSIGYNDGTITGTWTTDATSAIVIPESISGEGDGQSQHAIYSIPENHVLAGLNLRYGVESNKVAEFRVYTYDRSTGVRRCFGINNGIDRFISLIPLDPPVVIPGGYDLEIAARESSGNAIMTAAFEGWLVDLT